MQMIVSASRWLPPSIAKTLVNVHTPVLARLGAPSSHSSAGSVSRQGPTSKARGIISCGIPIKRR